MYKNQWLTPILVLMALSGLEAQAQTNKAVPRMVVEILVDRLQSDYLEAFEPLYGADGFRRLLDQGRVYTQASYDMVGLDRASAAALLATGAPAYDNGIIATRILDRNTLRPTDILTDSRHKGRFTSMTLSPQSLAVSTVSDELKIATQGKAMVYAIAPMPETAILLGGHAADVALWVDDVTGSWASSYYYPSFPAWAQSAASQLSGTRAIAAPWTPYNDLVGNFSYFASGGMQRPFKHTFTGSKRFKDYKSSALINQHVGQMAEACVRHTTIGQDAITDYLSVTFYAGTYQDASVADYPMELQDTYVRLDAALAQLLHTIDQRVGLAHTLVVLTSTGYTAAPQQDLAPYRIPTGTLDIARAGNFLNVYLTAIYGQGQYVEAAFGPYLYLNHKLIEQKNIALSELLSRAQDFLIQLSGVKDVYTATRIQQGAWTPGINRIRNGYSPKTAGDILLQVVPGWQLVNPPLNERQLVRESYTPFPIVFLGYNIVAQTIDTPVTVDCIAPTICKTIRIRAPNASAKAPLPGRW